MSIEQAVSVFGWMTVINLGIYLCAVAAIVLARDRLSAMQARLLGVRQQAWSALYVDYLSRCKIAILMLNLAPYLALKIVS